MAPPALVTNLAPGGPTCIGCKFGHEVAPLDLVAKFATKWHHARLTCSLKCYDASENKPFDGIIYISYGNYSTDFFPEWSPRTQPSQCFHCQIFSAHPDISISTPIMTRAKTWPGLVTWITDCLNMTMYQIDHHVSHWQWLF